MNYKFYSTFAIILIFTVVMGCASAASSVSTTNDTQNSGIMAEVTPKAGNAAVKKSSETAANNEVFDGKQIVKTAAEWKKILTPDQYHILREAGTEQPYSGEYAESHEDGDYYCAGCNLKLFSSKTKFDSGTGWPSFYQAVNKKNVLEIADKSHGMERVEVLCARCNGHLGHVFDDGPKPTGLRYCMNSLSLKFEKAGK